MKTKPPYHANGTTGFTDANGERICTGSQMGRRSFIPDDYNGERLHLHKMKWVDGDYDEGGAYFGGGRGDNVYCAFDEKTQIYVRAFSRPEAKQKIREHIQAATFYR